MGNQLQQYLQILYFAFFKPFTFKKWLQSIDSRLTANQNLLALLKLARIRRDRALNLYASKIFNLTIFVPFITIIIFLPIYAGLLQQKVNLIASCLFVIPWLISFLIACKKSYFGILLILLFNGLISSIIWLTPLHDILGLQTQNYILIPLISGATIGAISAIISDARLNLIFGIWLGISSITLWQVSWNQLLDYSLIIVLILATSTGLGLGLILVSALGVKKGIVTGVIWGIVSGIALGLMLGLTIKWELVFTVKWGLVWGISFILGVVRFYFWLVELMWMQLIFIISRWEKDADWLFYLPPLFDELIIFPLPYIQKLIVEFYITDSLTTRDIIKYLIQNTNQKKIGIKSVNQIAITILMQCKTSQDIALIVDHLSWITTQPSSPLSPFFYQLLRISQSVREIQNTNYPYRKQELMDWTIQVLLSLRQRFQDQKGAGIISLLRVVNRWLKILKV